MGQSLVSFNEVMLECFRSNKIYPNRYNQQNAKVFWAMSWVQLVVEKTPLKDTILKKANRSFLINGIVPKYFKSNKVDLNRPNQQNAKIF